MNWHMRMIVTLMENFMNHLIMVQCSMLFGYTTLLGSVRACPFSVRTPTRWWLSTPFPPALSGYVCRVFCFRKVSFSRIQHWTLVFSHICIPHEDAKNIHWQTRPSCILAVQYLGFRDTSCHSSGSANLLRRDSFEQGFPVWCPCHEPVT